MRVLCQVMYGAAVAVLVLAVIGAIQGLTSDSDVLFFESAQEENRTAFAFLTLIGGIAAAGVLAGVAAILQVMLDRNRDG